MLGQKHQPLLIFEADEAMIAVPGHDHGHTFPERGVRVTDKYMPYADNSKELSISTSDPDVSFLPYGHAQLLGLPEWEQADTRSRVQEDRGLSPLFIRVGRGSLGSDEQGVAGSLYSTRPAAHIL